MVRAKSGRDRRDRSGQCACLVMSAAGHRPSASVSQNLKAQLANAYSELGKELASSRLRVVGNYTLGKVIGEGASRFGRPCPTHALQVHMARFVSEPIALPPPVSPSSKSQSPCPPSSLVKSTITVNSIIPMSPRCTKSLQPSPPSGS